MVTNDQKTVHLFLPCPGHLGRVVQSWVGVKADSRSESRKRKFSVIIFVYNLSIESSKD